MVPFQEVLLEVRRVLEEAEPSLLPTLLNQLLDAQVFSVQYYQSLFRDADSGQGGSADADGLARKLALPIWQKWEASKGILFSMLVEKEDPGPDEVDETGDPGLCDLIPDTLFSAYIDSIDLSSPGFDESFDLCFSDDVFDISDEPDDKPTLGREDIKRQTRKRRSDKRPSKKPSRLKRNKGGNTGDPEASENYSDAITAPCEGSFQPSVRTIPQQLMHAPFAVTAATALESASLVPSSGQTLRIIHTINHLAHPVMNQIVPVRPTYVLVSPQSLGPISQVFPLSPADGAVAPLELSMSSHPTISLSDTASRVWFPSPLTPVSHSKGQIPDKIPPEDSTPPPHRTKKRLSPVIPKHVEDYIAHLKSHLKDTCSEKQAEISMASHYIETLLVPRKLVIRTGKNANKCLEKELLVLSDSERKKAMVDRTCIFQDCTLRSRHLVTILGKAGMGKSTLLQRLALDWSSGGLSQFHFVFLLDCKAVDLMRPCYSLKSLLFDLSASPRCKDSAAVFQHVLSSPEKVLILFDSFNEMKDLEGLLQASADSASHDGYSVRQLFSGIFQRKILSGCTLLIASRPKDVLNQLLRKVDSILELCPFSSTDIERYVSNYFTDDSRRESALRKIKRKKYIFSLCSNPLLCWFTCSLLERHDADTCALPSTLTDLCLGVVSQHLELEAKEQGSKLDITQLCSMAWEGFKSQRSLLSQEQQLSKELMDYGFGCRILTSHVVSEESGGTLATCFADLFVQSLLSALLLVQSRDVSEKTLVAQMALQHRKRKPQGEWQDLLQRFIMGLLYHRSPLPCSGLPHSPATSQAKRQVVETQLESLKPGELTPGKLLELFHCVYETSSVKLAKLLIKNLPDGLRFCGAQLSLTDAYVVEHLLRHAKGLGQMFSIDLQDTCVPLSGLKDIVAMNSIKSYRAFTMDTIDLWEDLHCSNDELNLKSAIDKFTIEPFKASQACHIENLALLVQIHREKKLPLGGAVSALDEGIPAVRHLYKLDYELGQQKGPEVFPCLVELLPALQSLQHLDLENNKIGDSGAEKLAGALQSLTSLKMLNLSQNSIGDAGLEKLAQALSEVSSLQKLSLYGNLIADSGAENLALVLPDMKSLLDLDVKYNKFTDIGAKKLSNALKSSTCMKSLQMWNGCIPYGVFEHLQLQDSRIRTLL
ncbi:MHC class II transactivator isoform X1 [Electrophorus electricus]|uniref:MHC class II transactivator isoform X1 n=1 Tax=Electrophorus electricus TaxID=8005 RepID=UPI0015D05B73|nr:MHC class II transactivator isoform X1 [Electrophorus electricus]